MNLLNPLPLAPSRKGRKDFPSPLEGEGRGRVILLGKERLLKRFLLFIGLLGLLCFLVPYHALASPALTVGHLAGKGLSPEVSPGESYSWTLLASIGKDHAATDVLIEVLGYGENPDEGVVPLSPEEDKSPYSARTFIQPDRITLYVEPGETKQVEVAVTIPADVESGGRYAILRFSTAPPEEGLVKIISVIVLPLKFTIKDSQLIHQGRITGVTTGEVVSGQPIEIFTLFQNSGNHHFNLRGQIEIRDASDKLIDTLHITTSSPIPEGTKGVKTTFIPQGELALGVYSIKSKVMLEDGTLLDEANGSFKVESLYVPPPPPASVTLTPTSASVLETEDGRISISFPQGAVISQVEVSLRSYPLEQIPAPPPDFVLATTCFRVDGLTGLLAKEAMVTTKYTAADLEKASGDASRLRLARWDEADNQWTVLKTKLDREAMTISTSTNRLSIWAVMAAPPKGTNWTLICGVVAGVIIIALLVYSLAVRQKGYQRRKRKGY